MNVRDSIFVFIGLLVGSISRDYYTGNNNTPVFMTGVIAFMLSQWLVCYILKKKPQE